MTSTQTPILRRSRLSLAVLRGSALLIILYVFAAILIGRGVVTQNHPDPSMTLYSQGLSPMPFRARYMMVPVLHWASTSPLVLRAAHAFKESSLGPEDLTVQFVDALCLLALGPLVIRLRNDLSPGRIFPWLGPSIFLWVITCTYVVRYESRLYLPYDLVSVVFFTLGLIACIEFRPLLLLFVLIAGTYNRETTIFLIPIWLTCNFDRSRLKLISAAAVGLIAYFFVRHQIHNWTGYSSSGILFTLPVSVRLITHPHHWPQLASVAGFLAIPLWLGRRLIYNPLLKRAWLGFIPLVLVALLVGWWNETRIFGELTSLIAVTAAIEFESYLRENNFTPASPQYLPAQHEMAG